MLIVLDVADDKPESKIYTTMSKLYNQFFLCIKLDQVLMMGKGWKMMKEVP